MDNRTVPGQMQALRLRAFNEMEIAEVAVPEPGPGEVLLRISTTGICGTDVHGFTGQNGRRQPGQVMGHETAGFLAGVGPGTDVDVDPGTVLTINPVLGCGQCPACAAGTPQACPDRRVIGVDPALVSAFAQFLVVPARNVVPLAADVPVEYGALVEPLAVGQHAVYQSRCGEQDRVLIVGGGPIGQACFLAAENTGAQVVVSEPHPDRRALLGRLGAETVGQLSDQDQDQLADRLGGPATVAIDAVGSSATVGTALGVTGDGARVVLVGMHEPRLELSAYAITTSERTLTGSFTYRDVDFRAAAEWVGDHWERLSGLVEEIVPLDAGPAAFTRSAEAVTSGKIMIDLTS